MGSILMMDGYQATGPALLLRLRIKCVRFMESWVFALIVLTLACADGPGYLGLDRIMTFGGPTSAPLRCNKSASFILAPLDCRFAGR